MKKTKISKLIIGMVWKVVEYFLNVIFTKNFMFAMI